MGLNQQLEDLVKAKKDHEDELLKKFAALLNTKNLKIRDQQRLLAGAKIPKDAAEAVRDARDSDVASGRRASGARRQKRKANSSAEPESADAETANESKRLSRRTTKLKTRGAKMASTLPRRLHSPA